MNWFYVEKAATYDSNTNTSDPAVASWTNTQEPIDWRIVGAWLIVFMGCAGFWASWAVLLVLALS